MNKSDMVVSKLFSAQWLMATGVTLGATFVVIYAVCKSSPYADTILAVYFTNWGIIIANYFKRDREGDIKQQVNKIEDKVNGG